MKKLLTFVSTVATGLIMTTSAYAYNDGIYAGAAIAYGAVYQSGFSDLNDTVNDNGGVAGRLFAGYKFNQYIALESGFVKFPNVDATGTDASIGFNASGTVKTYAFDLIAKGMFPLQNGFGLFATLGGAYLNQQAHISSSTGLSISEDDATQAIFAPTFGLGASYEFNQNIVSEVVWSRIQGSANHSNDVGNTDFVGLSLSYHFD